MKISLAPITNSSSASYILTVKCGAADLDEFRDALNKIFEEYHTDGWCEKDFKRVGFLDATDLTQGEDGTFILKEWTSMHNSYGDIPAYMRWIMISHFTGDLGGPWTKNMNVESFHIEKTG